MHEWVGWFMRLQTTGSFFLTAPLLSLLIPFPITSWTAVMMVSVLPLKLTRLAWLHQNSCGSIFANCNLSANFRKLLAPKFHYTLLTHALPSTWHTPHTPFLWSSTSGRSQQRATWPSALTSPPISSPISHRLVPSAKVNDLYIQAYWGKHLC